jgi:protein-disulfide isomerase
MGPSNYSKILVIVALIALIPLAGFFLADKEQTLPAGISLKTYGQPTIGEAKAPVHVVVFEEPKCPQCKNFTTRLFPKIKKEFIDTGKIRYTVIPVSFIPNSMPAAVAWLCVFNQEKNSPNHPLFFTYLDYMYAHQPVEYLDWAKRLSTNL